MPGDDLAPPRDDPAMPGDDLAPPRDDPAAEPVHVPGPRPLGGLADLAEVLGGESDRSRRLLRGLVAGALVGAAVAGALIRRRGRPSR